jgi:hypothetical protein
LLTLGEQSIGFSFTANERSEDIEREPLRAKEVLYIEAEHPHGSRGTDQEWMEKRGETKYK